MGPCPMGSNKVPLSIASNTGSPVPPRFPGRGHFIDLELGYKFADYCVFTKLVALYHYTFPPLLLPIPILTTRATRPGSQGIKNPIHTLEKS